MIILRLFDIIIYIMKTQIFSNDIAVERSYLRSTAFLWLRGNYTPKPFKCCWERSERAYGALQRVLCQVSANRWKNILFLEWNINEKLFSLLDAHICVLRHFLFNGYNFTFLAFELNTGHCKGSTDDFKTHIPTNSPTVYNIEKGEPDTSNSP